MATELGTYYVKIMPSTGGMGKAIEKDLNASSIGSSEGSKLGGGLLQGVMQTALGVGLGNMISAGVQAGMDAAKEIFTEAFNNIADYQQNVGGIQKLYGNMGQSVEEYAKSTGRSVAEVQSEWQSLENAQNTVLQNAQGAYKTTGMSANQYMETATSFSAALINSLGGDSEAAANQTQVAMQSISDNWNTFGGDLGMIEQAYQGFAKQNYTMLDNLKLGYGGTKTEMERLIADANEWGAANGKASDLSIDSFSDVVTAIDYIQQKQNIAGTTAREGMTTISGSMGMLNASWQNWLTALGDGEADMSQKTQELMESLGAVLENVIPIIGEIAASAIGELPNIIGQAMQTIGDALIPAIDEATGGAATGFIEGFQKIVEPLQESVLPVFQDIFGKISAFVQAAAPVISSIGGGAMHVLEGAANGLGFAFEALSPIIELVAGLIGDTLFAAFQVIDGVVSGVGDGIEALGEICQPVAEFITQLFEDVAEAIGPIVEGIGGLASDIGGFFQDPLGSITGFVDGTQAEMKKMETSTKKSTQGMAKAVTTDTKKMATDGTNNAKTMSTQVKGQAQGMSSSVSNQTKTMSNQASSSFRSMETNTTNSMSTAAKNTASSTKSMQGSINSLKGKTVEVGVKQEGNKTTGKLQGAIDGLKGKTVPIKMGYEQPKKLVVAYNRSVKLPGNVNLPLPSFSWAARGGFLVNKATVIGAGEAGTEAIVPVQNRRYMRPFAQAVAEEMGGGGGDIIVNLNYSAGADANQMARDIARNVKLYQKARG